LRRRRFAVRCGRLLRENCRSESGEEEKYEPDGRMQCFVRFRHN